MDRCTICNRVISMSLNHNSEEYNLDIKPVECSLESVSQGLCKHCYDGRKNGYHDVFCEIFGRFCH